MHVQGIRKHFLMLKLYCIFPLKILAKENIICTIGDNAYEKYVNTHNIEKINSPLNVWCIFSILLTVILQLLDFTNIIDF